jgi:4-amino-4-deoxy-L-arabinose transferase-like glycosyltransferase
VSLIQHVVRVGLLMAGAAGLFGWLTYHSDVTFADGLRYIRQAERIDRGSWSEGLIESVDHPLHPLAIASAHRLVGGEGPVSWQRAAQFAAVGAGVLLVIPLYLVTLEIYGSPAAWLGALLMVANPLMGHLVVNTLSECTFLLFWTWGLWGAVRFLREGRFLWLPLTIVFAALAYLARPEGMLLPLALVATLIVLPLHWATRIYWPRWWAAVAFLILGPVLIVGPYMAVKGGIGTKPSIARLIGTAPKSGAMAMEREKPLRPDQTTVETYRIATQRMIKVVRAAVTTPMLPFVLLGFVVTRPWSARARVWLFSGIILAVSAIGLIRLHATGGYCTVRHGLIPALMLTLAAANGISWLIRSVVIEGRWIGRPDERFRPGHAVWAVGLVALLASPYARTVGPARGSFATYRDAGSWLAEVKSHGDGKVLDMTNWSLYFSGMPGYPYSEVHWAAKDPETRWVVARDAHIHGRWPYSRYVRDLVGGRKPVIVFPEHPAPGQVQVLIYDRRTPDATPPIVATRLPGQQAENPQAKRVK